MSYHVVHKLIKRGKAITTRSLTALCDQLGLELGYATPKETEVVIVQMKYKNWKGEIGWRNIIPQAGTFRFAATSWHPEPQWLFDAWDLDKKAMRTFAQKDIIEWQPTEIKDSLPEPTSEAT